MKIIRKRKKLIKNAGERLVAQQLKELGLDYEFEANSFEYHIPKKYTPDFLVKTPKGELIVEVKGYHTGIASWASDMVHFLRQHPEIDYRIIFLDANKKFNRHYQSTMGDWANRNNITFSDKGIFPKEWLK